MHSPFKIRNGHNFLYQFFLTTYTTNRTQQGYVLVKNSYLFYTILTQLTSMQFLLKEIKDSQPTTYPNAGHAATFFQKIGQQQGYFLYYSQKIKYVSVKYFEAQLTKFLQFKIRSQHQFPSRTIALLYKFSNSTAHSKGQQALINNDQSAVLHNYNLVALNKRFLITLTVRALNHKTTIAD